ncbi:MAG: GNAT family N-acetyltransferase [Magnetovibrionaceae bacterium]
MSVPEFRTTTPSDAPALTTLYRETFPEEDLLPVVLELLAEPCDVLSLVVADGAELCGHLAFASCSVAQDPTKLSLLAPLGISPARQRQGLGTTLVQEGLDRLRQTGTEIVLVLGDPNYYSRFGFKPEDRILPPYDIPVEWAGAWQSLHLAQVHAWPQGRLQVLKPWQDPAYWVSTDQ